MTLSNGCILLVLFLPIRLVKWSTNHQYFLDCSSLCVLPILSIHSQWGSCPGFVLHSSKMSTPSSCKKHLTNFAVWQGALSCMKMDSGLIMPNTITLPPPNLTIDFIQFLDSLLPAHRRTNLFPSEPNKLNFDSSLKHTLAQSSSVHRTCFAAKLRRAFLFFLLIKGLTAGERGCKFASFRRRETVFLDTCIPCDSLTSREIAAAVLKRAFFDNLTRVLSSFFEVIRGLPEEIPATVELHLSYLASMSPTTLLDRFNVFGYVPY